eukprot:2979522-Prymnesium_polylepis.1
MYGIIRTLLAGTALDQIMHDERMGSAMQVNAVFERRPELEKQSRHLATTDACGSDDHQNPRSFLSVRSEGGKPVQDRRRIDVGGA